MINDNLTICGKDAVYRYTWPGRDESFICAEHSKKLQAVANAIGMPLQLIPIPPRSMPCSQKVAK